MQTLYVYVDGNDNEAQEVELTAAFAGLAHEWQALGAMFVNFKHEPDAGVDSNDCQDCFLGLNLPLERFGAVQAEQLFPVLRRLASITGREFVLGIAADSDISEDVVFIDAHAGERERQRLIQLANSSG